MGGRVPFCGGCGPGGSGPSGSGPGGREPGGHGPAGHGAGEHRADRQGNHEFGSSSRSIEYRLQYIPHSPDDSVGTSIPTDATLPLRSRSLSSMGNSPPITTLAADAIIAQNAAVIAAAATAAAELAETTASTAAAAIAAAAAQANQDDNIEKDLLIPLRVVPGRTKRFEPSVASTLGQIIHENVCKEGSNWTKVTRAMKNFYWDEFKKYSKWSGGMDKPVKHCWNTVAEKQDRDFINDRKKD